jgi:hypothetical protein
MSVPSHNLYDFIHLALEKRYWLLYFYPWGTRDLQDVFDYYNDGNDYRLFNGMAPSNLYAEKAFPKELITYDWMRSLQPILFCHDQEPLNYDAYKDGEPNMKRIEEFLKNEHDWPTPNLNLRAPIAMSWQHRWILLHSELNSLELKKYEDTDQYVGAFWWSHALLARDWYRFAEHDPSLNHIEEKQAVFLIYCRETTGTREYRNTFLNLLNDYNIKPQCQIGSFHQQPVEATASAIYESDDHAKTNISVVLETVFDDPRIHLTEKTLRPIACGHPFIIAAGAGTLEFLRKYGFQTFSPWINESYDQEPDSQKRLEMIAAEMKRIANLPDIQRNEIFGECKRIAEYNKTVFFSTSFTDTVVQELKDNVQHAWNTTKGELTPVVQWNIRQWRRKHKPNWFNTEYAKRVRPYVVKLIRHLRRGGSFEQYQRHDNCLSNESRSNSDNVKNILENNSSQEQ